MDNFEACSPEDLWELGVDSLVRKILQDWKINNDDMQPIHELYESYLREKESILNQTPKDIGTLLKGMDNTYLLPGSSMYGVLNPNNCESLNKKWVTTSISDALQPFAFLYPNGGDGERINPKHIDINHPIMINGMDYYTNPNNGILVGRDISFQFQDKKFIWVDVISRESPEFPYLLARLQKGSAVINLEWEEVISQGEWEHIRDTFDIDSTAYAIMDDGNWNTYIKGTDGTGYFKEAPFYFAEHTRTPWGNIYLTDGPQKKYIAFPPQEDTTVLTWEEFFALVQREREEMETPQEPSLVWEEVIPENTIPEVSIYWLDKPYDQLIWEVKQGISTNDWVIFPSTTGIDSVVDRAATINYGTFNYVYVKNPPGTEKPYFIQFWPDLPGEPSQRSKILLWEGIDNIKIDFETSIIYGVRKNDKREVSVHNDNGELSFQYK